MEEAFKVWPEGLPSSFFYYNEERKPPDLPEVYQLPTGSGSTADWTKVILLNTLIEIDEKGLHDKWLVPEVTDTRDCAVCAEKAIMEDLGKKFPYKS